jgi:large subunit ribosomal protein L7e
MPEVFVSNSMKQQRNYVHYKRNKSRIDLAQKAAGKEGFAFYDAATNPANRVKENSLLLVTRIKGYNTTTPQSQKILSEIGLRQINNAVFVRADEETIKKLMLVNDYVAFGYPSKKMVNDLIRKRGFLRKNEKKEAITNNVLIEELFAEFNKKTKGMGVICIEDIIECVNCCHKPDNFETFDEVMTILWPF